MFFHANMFGEISEQLVHSKGAPSLPGYEKGQLAFPQFLSLCVLSCGKVLSFTETLLSFEAGQREFKPPFSC